MGRHTIIRLYPLLLVLSLSFLFVVGFPNVNMVDAQTVESKAFGHSSNPNWLKVTVIEDVDFVNVDNGDGLIFKIRKGTAGYSEIWQNIVQIIANEQWVLQYLQGLNWKQRGIPQDVTWNQPSPFQAIVTRFYRDWGNPETTFNVTYDFNGGARPKITFRANIGQVDAYRLQWKTSGINKTHVLDVPAEHYVKFWNEGEDGVILDYTDVYEQIGDITDVELTVSANAHKVTQAFNIGLLNLGTFTLDPTLGYTTDPTLSWGLVENRIEGSVFTTTESASSVENMSCYLRTNFEDGTTWDMTGAIYKHSDLSLVAQTGEEVVDLSTTWAWYHFYFSSPKPSLDDATAYILVLWSSAESNSVYFGTDAGDTNQRHYDDDETYTGTYPDPMTVVGESGHVHGVYVTYLTNEAPTNEGVTITNMDDTNYLYSFKRYYQFEAKYNDSDGPSTIDHAMIGFSDGSHWVNATFDVQTNSWSLTSGSGVSDLDSGSCTNSTSGNQLTATFHIRLWWNISDASNIELYQFCNDTSGASDPWEEKQTNYANIETDLSVSGFACDDDRGSLSQTITFTGTVYYQGTSTYPPTSAFTAVHIYDSGDNDKGSDSSIVNGAFSVAFSAPASVGTETYNSYIDMAHASYTDAEDSNTDTFITDNIQATFNANITNPAKGDGVLFTVTLTREHDSTNVTSFSFNVNRNGTGFGNPHTTTTFTDTNSTEVIYVYDFTAVTDNTYGITVFTDPSDLTVSWVRDYPVLGGFDSTERIYGNDDGYLNVTIVDQDNNITAGTITFVNCTLQISGQIILKWDNATGVFSVYQDTKGYVTLYASECSTTTLNETAYRLSWNVVFGNDYEEGYKGAIATNTLVYDNTDLSASGSQNNYFYYDKEDVPQGGFTFTPIPSVEHPENYTWEDKGFKPYVPFEPYKPPADIPLDVGLWGLIFIIGGVMLVGLASQYTTKKPRSTKKRTRQKRSKPRDYEKRTKRKR